MGILDGKVAIITGGGRGLGRAEALRFAEEGCAVVVNDVGCGLDGKGVDPSIAADVVAEITAKGGRALVSTDDVTSAEQVERMLATAIAHFGKVDILVASAGIMADAPILETRPALFDPMMEVGMRGTYLCLAAVAKHLVSRGAPGRIVTTTSIAGYRGGPGIPLYSAAKAGIFGLSLAAAPELKPHGITVNVLSPLAVTRMTAEAMKGVPNAAEHFSASQVADVVLFLVSDLAADVTGAVIEVQGKQVSVSRVLQSEQLMPAAGDRWTPKELAERWPDIASLARQSQLTTKRTARTS